MLINDAGNDDAAGDPSGVHFSHDWCNRRARSHAGRDENDH